MRFFILFLGALCAGLCAASETATENLALAVTPEKAAAAVALPHTADLVFPGERNFTLQVPRAADWLTGGSIRITLDWPSNAPARAGVLVWLKDRDDYWHQYLCPSALIPGATNALTIPFQAGASGWQTPGHSLAWHYRVRLNPQSVGLRVFADTAFTGKCVLVSATLAKRSETAPPVIAKVTPLARAPQALALYELRFDLPDRYDNPFDPGQIDAGAVIVGPDGATNTVNAFYYIPHYRLEDELGKPVEPDGPPEWRVRYCPRKPGAYVVSLYARDPRGETRATNVLCFTAAAASGDAMRFVRVSAKDRRYFDLDDGSLFYPIGHNVRSATDSRMDDKFPWVFRHEEGSTAYRRYFARMQDSGENMGEVWMSAWSLGLEWTEGIGGYHGANDYHMGNAWELDRVMELAQKHRIHLNLVLNYHGRISTWLDAEWHLHPYNKATPGGWLEKPLEFFTDPRALDMQKRFCRYTQARWGWCPSIFGYELCSEINLTGPYFDDSEKEFRQRTHFKPAVVEWCRQMGDYIKSIDPYGHLVSAHVSNDYSILNPALCNLPEMDFNPLDAYNNGAPDNPERIIALAVGTANAGTPYNKPIFITEFGGSAMASSLENLKIEQHAAIWAGACLPLAGIPMFWWWQVVDENNLYGRYIAVRRFMDNVDPRDTSAKVIEVGLSSPENADKKLAQEFGAVCTASPEKARGYIYPKRFARTGETASDTHALVATLDGFTPGLFRVEFFETENGQSTRRFDVSTKDRQLVIPVPTFRSDCAFKIALLTPIAKK